MLAQAGEPPELRHAGHRFGENLQHGDGASEGDASPFLLAQLGAFSQERQGVLDGEATASEFQFLSFLALNGLRARGTYGEGCVVVGQRGPSLTGVAGYGKQRHLVFMRALILGDTDRKPNRNYIYQLVVGFFLMDLSELFIVKLVLLCLQVFHADFLAVFE